MSQRAGTTRVLRAVLAAYAGDGAQALPAAFKAAAAELGMAQDDVEAIARDAHLATEGKTLIFKGQPCRHQHDGTRYVSTGHCVTCAREASARQWDATKRKSSEGNT